MARQVIVHLLCDPCMADEERTTEGVTETPPMNLPGVGGRPRVLALCERHRKELLDPLVEVLREHGQPVDDDGQPVASSKAPKSRKRGSAFQGGDFGCPVPECDYTGPSRNALDQHCRSRHGGGLRVVMGEAEEITCTHADCTSVMSHPSGWHRHWITKHPETTPDPWPGPSQGVVQAS